MSIFNLGYSPMQIYAIPSQSGSLTFNGSEQFPVWKNFNSAQLQIGGITSATDAGSYTATFTPKPGFKWPDGTNVAKSVSWVIEKRTIGGTPSQNGSLTYNGSAQAPSWSGYDSAQLQIGGDTSATDAGSYTATFTPKPNHQWSDGTTGSRNASWKISKAAGSLSINPTSLSLTSSAHTKTITVSRAGNGAISATSSNTGVATVSVSGNTVTVKGVTTGAGGSTTITVKVAEGTNHTAPGNKTCAVSAVFRLTPEFTYTGICQIVNDSDAVISDFANYRGNWKIRFLTSGDFEITKMHGFTGKIDVFLVGGGGGGEGTSNDTSWDAGAAGGYTNTFRGLTVNTNTIYHIVVGSGGSPAKNDPTAGGSTSAFGKKVSGSLGKDGGSGAGGSTSNKGTITGGADGYDGSYGKGQRTLPGPNGETGSTREFGESTGKLYSGAGGGTNADGADGGGGNGSWQLNETHIPTAGASNTGGGGGGGDNTRSGKPGGSGIAIIRNAR